MQGVGVRKKGVQGGEDLRGRGTSALQTYRGNPLLMPLAALPLTLWFSSPLERQRLRNKYRWVKSQKIRS
jgi:hypothetical protein